MPWNVGGAGALPSLAKMSALNASGQIFAASTFFTTLANWTSQLDVGGGLVAATGLYTAPFAGYYLVEAGILTNAVPQNSSVFLSIFANAVEKYRGAIVTPATGGSSGNTAIRVGGIVQASKNDVIRLALTNLASGSAAVSLFAAGICNEWSIAQQL